MARLVNPIAKYKPGSELRFYNSDTSTPINTFADEDETIQNAWPVVCDTDGYPPNIFFTGSARLIVHDQNGVQYLERDPVGSEKELGDFTLWDSQVNYSKNDITERNDKFYQSFDDDNQGNDPATSATKWFEIRFVPVYNVNKTFSLGDVCQTSNGAMWRSVVNSNLNNDPTTDDGSNWLPAVDSSKIPEIIKLNWKSESSDFTAVNNEAYQIDASGGTVDVTLPTIAAGNAFTFHNESISTNKVQILNPSYTIKGPNGSIASGTDMELAAGDSVQMVAKNTTVLEIVGAQV